MHTARTADSALLENVDPGFAEFECTVTERREEGEHEEWEVAAPPRDEVVLVRDDLGDERDDEVEEGHDRERDEHLPGGEDVAGLDLDCGRGEGLCGVSCS